MTDAQERMFDEIAARGSVDVDGRGLRTAAALYRLGLVLEPEHIWGTSRPALYRVGLALHRP